MAGAVADRELSRTLFAVATPADEAEIRRLLRENPMGGAVRLTFEREPDYFRGANLAGAEDETILARVDGRLVCLGRCSRRASWWNGRATRTGYLAELRLDRTASGQFSLVRGGYRYFQERAAEDSAEVYFTSIAADNDRARRFLERGARGMPVYRELAELCTLVIAVPRQAARARVQLRSATNSEWPEVLKMLNDWHRRFQLSAVWTEETLREIGPLQLVLDGGRIMGCGVLWDQRAFRQTVIQGYQGALAGFRPLINAGLKLLGRPALPAPGSALAQAFLTAQGWRPGAEGLLPELIAALLPIAAQRGLNYLTLALPSADPRLKAILCRFSARVYRSRLYRVTWPGEAVCESTETGNIYWPEVAWL